MVERAAPIIAKHARIPQHTELIAINASAESEARFREYVKAGTVLCARPIQPFERGRPVCGGRGPYGNSMMGRSGVEVRHGRAPGRTTRQLAYRSWLRQKSRMKKVVEEAERRE